MWVLIICHFNSVSTINVLHSEFPSSLFIFLVSDASTVLGHQRFLPLSSLYLSLHDLLVCSMEGLSLSLILSTFYMNGMDCSLCYLSRDTITKYKKLGHLNNRNVSFPSSGG
jgi:hypothetical protein